jgi:hypothetical protein
MTIASACGSATAIAKPTAVAVTTIRTLAATSSGQSNRKVRS